ncbi:A/G-specific adenine glycosylase, partial [Schumannella luteola]
RIRDVGLARAHDARIAGLWPDDAQRDRSLAGLLADGLVEAAGDGYALPSS